jgi:hypothetical protein
MKEQGLKYPSEATCSQIVFRGATQALKDQYSKNNDETLDALLSSPDHQDQVLKNAENALRHLLAAMEQLGMLQESIEAGRVMKRVREQLGRKREHKAVEGI